MKSRLFALFLVAFGVGSGMVSAGPATFVTIAPPSGDWTNVELLGISADGRVGAGNIFNSAGTARAFRWTRQGGMDIALSPFRASALSSNGRVVVGSREVAGAPGSFVGFATRWDGASVTDFIGPTANTVWRPTAANADASVVPLTGIVINPINTTRIGQIWTAVPMPNLVQPGRDWTVYDLADDASVLIGQSGPSSLFTGDPRLYRPYRRNLLGSVFQDIVAPSGVPADGEAISISADGWTITGRLTEGNTINPRRAFVWNAVLGARFLPSLADGTQGIPRGISGDGWIIVGEDQINLGESLAVVWRGGVIQRLDALLLAQHASLPHGIVLDRAWSVSNDGRSIVGQAHVPGGSDLAFVATLGTPCDADQDDGSGQGIPDAGVTTDDLLYFLAQYAEGRARADLDDGTNSGTPDGGVTIEDLLYYLVRFDAGC